MFLWMTHKDVKRKPKGGGQAHLNPALLILQFSPPGNSKAMEDPIPELCRQASHETAYGRATKARFVRGRWWELSES